MSHDELEFQKIHDTFRPRIRRYLTRLAGEGEAEDLTQEVFVKVSQALSSFRGESKLSTRLYRIATNAALDRVRSRSFQQMTQERPPGDSTEQGEAPLDEEEIWTEGRTPSVEQQVVRKEMNECIRDFIASLPESYRAVLVLNEFEGLRNKEIAESWELAWTRSRSGCIAPERN